MRRHGQHCDADPRQCGAQNVGSGAYRRIAHVGGRNVASVRAHDGYAVADLGPRRRRQILRRLCRLHDRRRASAVRARVQHRRLSTWRHRRGEPVWHSRRRSRARQLVGPLRPQAHVHRRDDHLRGVSRGALLCVELRPGGDLPVRPGACARVRLPDRAYDHFRKHPELSARQIGAWRVRVSGGGRARRHSRRVSRSVSFARTRRLALDVRQRDHSRCAGHAWPLLYCGERQLAVEPGRD